MEKEAQIILLKSTMGSIFIEDDGTYSYHKEKVKSDGIGSANELYFITKEKIKEGDFYIHNQKGTGLRVQKAIGNNIPMDAKKIIASTDSSLITKEYDGLDEKGHKQYCNKTLPRPSSDFIKKFCELNGDIKDVLVELLSDTKSRIRSTVHYGQPVNSIKIAPDNTISIIKKPKERLYTRREMEYSFNAGLLFAKDVLGEQPNFEEWIDKQLK